MALAASRLLQSRQSARKVSITSCVCFDQCSVERCKASPVTGGCQAESSCNRLRRGDVACCRMSSVMQIQPVGAHLDQQRVEQHLRLAVQAAMISARRVPHHRQDPATISSAHQCRGVSVGGPVRIDNRALDCGKPPSRNIMHRRSHQPNTLVQRKSIFASAVCPDSPSSRRKILFAAQHRRAPERPEPAASSCQAARRYHPAAAAAIVLP